MGWENDDLKRGLLTIQAVYAKSGQTRTIPLNSPARVALERLKSLTQGELVFSKPDGTSYRSIQKHFSRACKRAGLKDVTLHTLRYTFASRLAMAGIDVKTI